MDHPLRDEERLFEAARHIDTPEDRSRSWLRPVRTTPSFVIASSGCLASHAEAGRFLEPPELANRFAGRCDADARNRGTIIGRYKLLERIGEGGFGVVYMAEQQEPVRRKVALKIIKLGHGHPGR